MLDGQQLLYRCEFLLILKQSTIAPTIGYLRRLAPHPRLCRNARLGILWPWLWLVIQSVSARSGHEWDRESVTSALALWFVTVNMTKKLVKFLILFDNTNLLYFPGQFLTGRVLVELKDDTPALGESRSSTIIPPPLDLWGGISQFILPCHISFLTFSSTIGLL